MQPLSVTSNIDSLDSVKNPAIAPTAHVHQMIGSDRQDGAILQQAGNVCRDNENMTMVSLQQSSVMYCSVVLHISANSHQCHPHY